jgi:hypothetical protein
MSCKYFRYRAFIALLLIVMIVSACNMPGYRGEPQTAPDTIGTAAAQTVVAQLTVGPVSQGGTPLAITATLAPSEQPAVTDQPSQTSATEPAGITPSPGTASATACDRGGFVGDVTFPDGSTVAPGAAFVKTWRLKNTGSCTWDSNYSVVFVDKNSMGAPSSLPLTSASVAPGKTLDVSINLQAPETPGAYEGDWKLRNATGQVFGLGSDASSPFWVKVNVVNGARLSMAPGRTAVQKDGQVAKNSRTTYLVRAGANNYMMVAINAPNKPLALEIQAPNGSMLVKASDQKNTWQGNLPADGDYLVSIVNGGDATDFNVSVTIPARVTFARGATSAKVDGLAGGKETNSYLLRAQKGQQMTVEITSKNGDIFVAIYGLQDGQPYVPSQPGQTTATIDLPATQDYVIQAVNTGDSEEKYTLGITVK